MVLDERRRINGYRSQFYRQMKNKIKIKISQSKQNSQKCFVECLKLQHTCQKIVCVSNILSKIYIFIYIYLLYLFNEHNKGQKMSKIQDDRDFHYQLNSFGNAPTHVQFFSRQSIQVPTFLPICCAAVKFCEICV